MPVRLYPAFLNLSKKKVVVIGGGKVAERKVRSFVPTGAAITVVSPSLTPGLKRLKEKELLCHISRRYRKGDLRNAFLAIAATDSGVVNARIVGEVTGLVNVADRPSECSFIVPSVVARGPLQIAISTSGVSPAVSKTIRKELGQLYGRDFIAYLKIVKQMRREALALPVDRSARVLFLRHLASPEILEELRTRGFPAVRKKLTRAFNKLHAHSSIPRCSRTQPN